MNEDIIAQLQQIIANKLDVNLKLEEVKADASLFEDGLGLDSIAIMEFISLVEADFGFKFTEEELNLEAFKDIRTVAGFVAAKINGAPAIAA